MIRPRVRLGIPPHLADLELWGRDVGGEMVGLGCVVDAGHTARWPPPGPGWLRRVGARRASGTADAGGRIPPVRRMQLPAESAEWPAPVDRPGAHWRGYYLGILDGAEPQLPAEAGRAWGTEQGGAYG